MPSVEDSKELLLGIYLASGYPCVFVGLVALMPAFMLVPGWVVGWI